MLQGQAQAALFVCACFWAYAAVVAAGAQNADCKLVLLGGETSGSFSEVVLECSSQTGTPVDIAVGRGLKKFVTVSRHWC